MKARPQDLYLELTKKTLSYSLWPEPPIPVETVIYRMHPLKRLLISVISRILSHKKLQLACKRDFIWPGYAFTMVGMKRLDNLQFCVETAIRDGVEGDLIETGVWMGGSRAVLAAYCVADRKVYVADSFEGLPEPDPENFPADKGDKFYIERFANKSL